MITPDQFLQLQAELYWAFGPLARWWLIMFLVGGIAIAVLIFFLTFLADWLERSR